MYIVYITYLLCIAVISLVVQGEILVDGVVQCIGGAENSSFLVLMVSGARALGINGVLVRVSWVVENIVLS